MAAVLGVSGGIKLNSRTFLLYVEENTKYPVVDLHISNIF